MNLNEMDRNFMMTLPIKLLFISQHKSLVILAPETHVAPKSRMARFMEAPPRRGQTNEDLPLAELMCSRATRLSDVILGTAEPLSIRPAIAHIVDVARIRMDSTLSHQAKRDEDKPQAFFSIFGNASQSPVPRFNDIENIRSRNLHDSKDRASAGRLSNSFRMSPCKRLILFSIWDQTSEAGAVLHCEDCELRLGEDCEFSPSA
jgi:hypothetical protein